MVIVLIQNNPAPGQPMAQPLLHLENGQPDQAIAVLQWAQQVITEQIAGPKVFLPNGQTHIVPPPQVQQQTPEAP
jgi:hypothetical protein